MAELETILSDIAKAIVDEPDKVVVRREGDSDTITLKLNVAPDDMGKVIGKHGKIARAIRMVVKSAANLDGKRVNVDIED